VEVEMLGSFVGEGGRPVDGGFVVVEDRRAVVGVGETEVTGQMADSEEFDDAGVRGGDFGLAGAARSLVLTNRFPGNGPP
jgi:hypothetical protein